jgi:hypothetical protein
MILHRRIFVLVLPLLACLLALVSLPATAQPEEADKLKAVFVYNFAQYVKWPESMPDTPEFQLCLTGTSRVIEALQRLQGETLNQRQIRVRSLHLGDDPSGCRLLFIGESELPRLEFLLETIDALPVLTVSDLPGFAASGGMIGFFWEGSKIRFEINHQAANAAGLALSSRLLKLARLVGEQP